MYYATPTLLPPTHLILTRYVVSQMLLVKVVIVSSSENIHNYMSSL